MLSSFNLNNKLLGSSKLLPKLKRKKLCTLSQLKKEKPSCMIYLILKQIKKIDLKVQWYQEVSKVQVILKMVKIYCKSRNQKVNSIQLTSYQNSYHYRIKILAEADFMDEMIKGRQVQIN